MVLTARVAVSESTDGDTDAGTSVERDDGSVDCDSASVDVGGDYGSGSFGGDDGGMRVERDDGIVGGVGESMAVGSGCRRWCQQ